MPECIGGEHEDTGGVVCRPVHVYICDTFNAAGPHSPSGMWDFQVENRAWRGRNNSSRMGAVEKKKAWRVRGGQRMTCMIRANQVGFLFSSECRGGSTRL